MPAKTRKSTGSRHTHRIVLEDWKNQKHAEGAIEIEAAGRTFVIPPVQLWSDEAVAALTRSDFKTAVIDVMGEDDFAAFVDAGGTANIVANIVEDSLGADLGE